jgi:carbon-monoxide dehydrogenase large subunit
MALAEDGKFLAMDVDLMGDMGAYLSTFGAYIPHGGAGMLPGLYDIQAFHCRVRTVFTHTVPVDAYRGAGRPEAAYVVERLVDACARKLGMTPDAIRRKNFISPKAMPYKTATGKIYDSGDFNAHMKRAMEIAEWKEFPKRARLAKKQGLVRGIGLASYVEVCGSMGMDETANVRLEPSGDVTVLIGSQSTGQGHQTAYAQIVADQFGLPPERVHIHQGDTDEIASGLGTGGSSSIPTGGVCVERATRELGNKLKEVAAEALETSASDLEVSNGTVRIAGTDRSISFAELAKRPGVDPSKLKGSAAFTSADGTYPNGTHLAEVEIDPATGIVRIVNYVIVDDFGVTLNPLLLEGQVHGGAMQGIGQALMEQVVYSPTDGQLVTGTFMDYALPRAADGPAFVFETHNVPCKTNPLGVKGAGEAGAIGSCPAVVNAIIDALWREYKIDHIDMPATAERVWIAIREHQRRHSL